MKLVSSEITAVVPVRAGSRRLPGKNMASFLGKPLLQHKLDQLGQLFAKDQILVSSDSEQMLDLALENGVLVHERQSEFADDVEGKPLGETIAHIASFAGTEHVLWAQVTSPIVEAENYRDGVVRYFEGLNAGFDSLVSVQRVREYLRNEAGPLNYKIGNGHTPSQFLPDIWKITYGMVMAPRKSMMAWGYYYGNNPFLLEVDKFTAMDIDDHQDLVLAELVARHLGL